MNLTDLENMSDDEFADLQAPVVQTPVEGEQQEEQQQQEEELPEKEEAEADSSKTEAEADAGGAEGDDKEGEKPKDENLSDDDHDKQTPPVLDKLEGEKAPVDDKKPEPKTVEQPEKKDPPAKTEKPKKEGEVKEPVEEQAIDYKSEFEKLVGKPIKANGKDLVLKNTDEVLRLVQQGAGYAAKMEQLKPARKSAAMLEAAGLLGDEAALSHMIDLYNGNPQAIAKMAKDLKIDLYALDLDAGDQYKPTSHLQTDEAVNFADTLKEVRTLEGGQEALTLIDKMDQKSKDMLWGNALAIRQIYDYKQSGVYDTVATEVERRRTLGQIPADVPFIVAFEQVGQEIAKASETTATAPVVQQPVNTPETVPAKPVARTPVATGPAPRKAEVPDARAAAAASPRGGVAKVAQPMDIYSYSDADIEKMSAPPV